MPRRLGKVVVRIWLTAVCGRRGDIAIRGVIMSPRRAVFFEAWPLAISLRETTSKEGMAGTRGGEERLGFGRHDPTAGGMVPGVSSARPQSPATHIGYRKRCMSAPRRNSSALRWKADVLWEPGILPVMTQAVWELLFGGRDEILIY